MPDFDGMTALRIRNEVSPLIPFIIVTGSINEDTAVKCIKAGADDYVIKEHIGRITSSIKSALEKYELNLEKEKAQNALIESEKNTGILSIISQLEFIRYPLTEPCFR